jgi:hypothetical protein
MGAQRTSFAKLQRDRAKKANAAAKRERRQAKQDNTDETPAAPLPPASGEQGGELSAAELLQQIEHVHQQFEAKQIDQEQYDEKKAELLARLPID